MADASQPLVPTPDDSTADPLAETLALAAAAVARAQSLEAANRALLAPSDAGQPAGQLVEAEASSSHQALRESVWRYSAALREAGVPPERVLRRVKDAVEPALRASAGAPLASASAVARQRQALVSDVVRWSIEAYYAA